MVKFISIFTATCTNVFCYFTIDNIVEWARYDGNILTNSTLDVKNYVTFESCYDSNPGTLFIKGRNDQYDAGTGI